MAVDITKLMDVVGDARASYTVSAWALWAGGDITVAPTENGTNVSSDATGKLTVPCTPNGILMLRTSDTEMQLLNVDNLKT